jgi:hypothetical protein
MKTNTNQSKEKAEQKIRQSIQSGERLITTIVGYKSIGQSNIPIQFGSSPIAFNTIYYVGLTNKYSVKCKISKKYPWLIGLGLNIPQSTS